MFLSQSGDTQAVIYPLLWTDVRVESVGTFTESVCITEQERSYVVRSWDARESADPQASKQAAEAQTSDWANLQAVLHILFGRRCRDRCRPVSGCPNFGPLHPCHREKSYLVPQRVSRARQQTRR